MALLVGAVCVAHSRAQGRSLLPAGGVSWPSLLRRDVPIIAAAAGVCVAADRGLACRQGVSQPAHQTLLSYTALKAKFEIRVRDRCVVCHTCTYIFYFETRLSYGGSGFPSNLLCLGRGGTTARRRGSAALGGSLLLCDVTRSGDPPARGGRLGEGEGAGRRDTESLAALQFKDERLSL